MFARYIRCRACGRHWTNVAAIIAGTCIIGRPDLHIRWQKRVGAKRTAPRWANIAFIQMPRDPVWATIGLAIAHRVGGPRHQVVVGVLACLRGIAQQQSSLPVGTAAPRKVEELSVLGFAFAPAFAFVPEFALPPDAACTLGAALSGLTGLVRHPAKARQPRTAATTCRREKIRSIEHSIMM